MKYTEIVMDEIQPLTDISSDMLYKAWADAFSDYLVTLTLPELEKMLARRGYNPSLSFGAFDNGQLVSFILNGTGLFEGQNTVYDTGTGTIAAYRGQGLVKKIFNASLPELQEAGYTQYLLEVLQDNEAAVALYKGLGFTVTRDFNYFKQSMDDLQLYDKPMPASYRLEVIDMAHADEMRAMWDFNPSWQNSFDSVNRTFKDFKIIGAFKGNQLAGYGIMEPTSGDMTQIAVHKDYRRQGIATQILHALLPHNKCNVVKVINTAATCTSITAFFEKNGIPKKAMQYEMVRRIVEH